MTSTRELHYRYVCSYFVATIILLLALAYYDVTDLVDKLSFALTLSSLLLAILAIFYTIVSAQKQDMQLTKLVETNTSLNNTANNINDAANEMRAFAREAPQHFQSLRTTLEDMSSNFDSVKTAASPQTTEEYQEKKTFSPPEIDQRQFRWMFGRLHFSAMAVLYLFAKACGKSVPIERDVFEELEISTYDYAVGVLNGLESTGLISFKIHNLTVIPIECASVVTEETLDAIAVIQKIVGQEAAQRLNKLVSSIDGHLS